MAQQHQRRFSQNKIQRHYSGSYYRDQGGFYFNGYASVHGWRQDYFITGVGTVGNSIRVDLSNVAEDAYNMFLSADKRLIVWNLPGDESALQDAPALPPNGTKVVHISSSAMKISKPGYPVDTATVNQLAFDINARPVKVIAGNDIAVPPGVSEYEIGLSLGEEIAADIHFYDTPQVFYPCNPKSADYGAEYWFEGTKLKFYNPYGACRARFMVYLEDNTPPSAGSFKVFRTFQEGGQNVIQFLRPGAANPPALADIVIDSRWPALQLLAEGHIPVGGGALQHVVNFDGTGMFPMVKYMTIHGAANINNAEGWSKEVRLPAMKQLLYGSTLHAGDSSYCMLEQHKATFFTYRGNPVDYYRNWNNTAWVTSADGYPVLGIRYFIFGIPA